MRTKKKYTLSTQNTAEAERFLRSITEARKNEYITYWTKKVVPATLHHRLMFVLYAVMSIQTDRDKVSRVFDYIKNKLVTAPSVAYIQQLLLNEGTGFQNKNAEIMYALKCAGGGILYLRQGESYPAAVHRLSKAKGTKIKGLGRAKASFALEMLNPLDCRVLCVDSQQYKLYNIPIKQRGKAAVYDAIEAHWLAACDALKLPPVLARFMYWDSISHKDNSKYWAYALEA